MIRRAPERAAGRSYDLLVVGGGVQGIATALEAARRGLATLLIEQADFGGAISANSLRIVHGGLRYLQSVDLGRYSQTVIERQWWLRHFPGLVEVVPCVMPLYGRGLRRRSVVRLALAMNDGIHRVVAERDQGSVPLPRGGILDADDVVRAYGGVRRDGLQGGAVWHEAILASPQRIMVEMLHWACECGAEALNYVRVTDLLMEGRSCRGVAAVDGLTQRRYEFRAPNVVNAAGAQCNEVAKLFDPTSPRVCTPSLAFNLLLDRAPMSRGILAVEPPEGGSATYFLVPCGNRLLAGTVHLPCPPGSPRTPSEADTNAFIAQLNLSLPKLRLTQADVTEVLFGYLPCRRRGSTRLSSRARILDHGARGGPVGLFSVAGVKLTMARRVAEDTIRRVMAARSASMPPVGPVAPPCPRQLPTRTEMVGRTLNDTARARAELSALVREEAVVHTEDLLLRRTDWGVGGADSIALARLVEEVL